MENELHILIGGTGTGKATYAKKLKKNIGIDIFCPDDIEAKYIIFTSDQIDKIVDNELKNHLNSGESFILDGKCLIPQKKIEIIKRAKNKGFKVYGYDFGSGNVMSLLRRLRNPRKYFSNYWETIYESDQRLYKSPTIKEGFEKIYYTPK